MVDISALFGSSNAFSDVLRARSYIPGRTAASQTAATVKDTIANATRLDGNGRKTLNNLTDTVSKFANGNTKLLRDVVGISNLLQIGAKEQLNTGNSPYAGLLNAYYASKTGSILDYKA